MSQTENVLCISSHYLDHFLRTARRNSPPTAHPAWFPASMVGLEHLVNLANATEFRVPLYLPRSDCETDKRFRQLVSYSVIEINGYVFNYSRGKSGGESRLHAFRSCGVGGHISDADIVGPATVDSLFSAVSRELYEEVEQFPALHLTPTYEGIICDLNPSKDVDAVHVGIVYRFSGDVNGSEWLKPREDCLADPDFSRPVDILSNINSYETWSQVVIKSLMFLWNYY